MHVCLKRSYSISAADLQTAFHAPPDTEVDEFDEDLKGGTTCLCINLCLRMQWPQQAAEQQVTQPALSLHTFQGLWLKAFTFLRCNSKGQIYQLQEIILGSRKALLLWKMFISFATMFNFMCIQTGLLVITVSVHVDPWQLQKDCDTFRLDMILFKKWWSWICMNRSSEGTE